MKGKNLVDKYRKNAIIFLFPPNFPPESPKKRYCFDYRTTAIFNEHYKGYKLCWRCKDRFNSHPHLVKDANTTHIIDYDALLNRIIEENLLQ